MRFHVVSLPHTKTNKDYAACAYTQKVLNFCKMMQEILGYKTFHYGAEGSAVCCEHIPIITDAEQTHYFGPYDPQKLPPVEFHPGKEYWNLCNTRAIFEIAKRMQEKDFLCIIAGRCQEQIANALPKLIPVEYGIGYTGPFAEFRVYESYSHMHFMYGNHGLNCDGRNYDAVIPNYYDLQDFSGEYPKEDYFLFIGRLVNRKGLTVAIETCKRLGAPLVVAGQGGRMVDGKLVTDDNTYEYEKLKYVGFANTQERKSLMYHAKSVFVPTVYVEPFGGVAAEAQLCGTPVITTDFGAFTETVEHGKTGYRCRTLDHFVFAAKNVDTLDRAYIRKRAESLWSLQRVARMYDEYFRMVQGLYNGHDYYYVNPDRKSLDWLSPMPDASDIICDGCKNPLEKYGCQVVDFSVNELAKIKVICRKPQPTCPKCNQLLSKYGCESHHLSGSKRATVICNKPVNPNYVINENFPHLGGNIKGGDPCTTTPKLWQWLVETLKPRSVFDVGCGEGHALYGFKKLGCTAYGIDGLTENVANARDRLDIWPIPVTQWDLQHGPRTVIVDLVYCVEVVEHIEEKYLDNLLQTLTCGTWLVMTHAIPGQAGWHHVNCRDSGYWISNLHRYGFEFCDSLTQSARRICEDGTHFKNTGMIFKRRDDERQIKEMAKQASGYSYYNNSREP